MPELDLNKGWGNIAANILKFTDKGVRNIVARQLPILVNSFAEAVAKRKWSFIDGHHMIEQSSNNICFEVDDGVADDGRLTRCLVGSFSMKS